MVQGRRTPATLQTLAWWAELTQNFSGQCCQIRDILGHGRWRPVRFWTKPATWLDEKRPPVVSLTALASHWSKPVTWHSRRVRSAANYLCESLNDVRCWHFCNQVVIFELSRTGPPARRHLLHLRDSCCGWFLCSMSPRSRRDRVNWAHTAAQKWMKIDAHGTNQTL